METIALNGMEEVGSDFVEKIIYWNQKLMKKLDLIYWLPDAEKVLTDIKEDEEIYLDKWFEHSVEIFARIPTISLPITVITALILSSVKYPKF